MHEEFEPAIKVLWDFIAAMRSWQLAAAKNQRKLDTDPDTKAMILEEVREIYWQFMQSPRMPPNIGFPTKPSYDPKSEKVVELKKSGKKLFVVTDRTANLPHMRVRYTLIDTPDGYKLKDSIQRYGEVDEKFVKWDFML